MSTINFADLMQNAGASFEPLPDGQYDVVIAKSEATTSSNGKHMWKVRFKVLAGPHKDKAVFNNFVLSPENGNALSFFFQHMNALGLGPDFFATNPTPDQIADALLDRSATIRVGHRTYQGQTRNEVKAVLPLSGVAPTGVAAAAPPPPPPPAATAPAPPAPTPPTPPAPAPDPTPAPTPPAPAPDPTPPAPTTSEEPSEEPAGGAPEEQVREPQAAPPIPATAGAGAPPPVPF